MSELAKDKTKPSDQVQLASGSKKALQKQTEAKSNKASAQIPKLKGGFPLIGHIASFAMNPFFFMKRVSDELGEIAQFRLFNQTMVLLTGDEASKVFYRSSDDQLDQSAAYKLMTPIFGEGIIFDAPNALKNEQLKMLMPSLRMEAMKQHSGKIVQEVDEMIAHWGDNGEIELVEEMKQLTINTASHCLLGKEFRYELTNEFSEIYHDLEKGISPLAYNFPNLPIPSFRKRDKARVRLHKLVGEIVQKREVQKEKPSDMFQMLIDNRYSDGSKLSTNEITGMLVGAIFAGHHTSSGTAAWVLLELLKQPQHLKAVKQELDDLLGSEGEVSFESLREMPKLENVLKEVLRLHPPLIVLMRQVSEDIQFKEYMIKEGDMVWASPPVTHRMSHLFPNPEQFDPDRYTSERAEDKNLMAYQPFGGGKHKCSGNAFAMFQIKAIFAILLRKYDFELSNSAEQYVDDYKEIIVQPKSPSPVAFKLREKSCFKSQWGSIGPSSETTQVKNASSPRDCPMHQTSDHSNRFDIHVDTQLCQGHAMCMGEAPELFQVDDKGLLKVLNKNPENTLLSKAKIAAAHCPNQAITIKTK